MLDVTLLGTGGMVPLPNRFLTSLMIRYAGAAFLIDCGEGTQVAIKTAGLGIKQIAAIFLTHFHGDHTAGLPGLLLSMGNAGKDAPLTIIGPTGIKHVVESLKVIAPELPFPISYIELDFEQAFSGQSEITDVYQWKNCSFSACPVPHTLPCFAYRLNLSRAGKFQKEQAIALGLPEKYWGRLQAGQQIEYKGKQFYPQDVLDAPRRGIRLSYATDLRPTKELIQFVTESDLLICEGQYGDPAKREKALEYQHCLFSEAAMIAKQARAKELWLTHFSPSLPDPLEWISEALDIFPNTHVDKKNQTLSFK